MAINDRMTVNGILRGYKTERGAVNYPAILSVPVENRIPALAKNDFKKVIGLITAALTLAMEGMNLVRGMNPIQTLDLAEAIVDTSTEDNLSMEDLMLFLQKLVRGEYGKMYESMDIPKFMLAFEEYREQRHNALISIKENKHMEFKSMGDTNRSNVKTELDEHFFSMANRLSELKSELKEKTKENKKLKDIDKF